MRRELEQEGVTVDGLRTPQTPQTLVHAVRRRPRDGHRRPGARARAADVAAQMPAGVVAANLEQLHLVPQEARVLLTCGEDDARAFAGRLPAGIDRATALFLDDHDAQVLTGTNELAAAVNRLAEQRPDDRRDARVAAGGRDPPGRAAGDRRSSTPGPRSTRPATATCCAPRTPGRTSAAPTRASRIAWAQLYAALAVTVPTATAGAVTEEALLAEGVKRGLEPPPRARRR